MSTNLPYMANQTPTFPTLHLAFIGRKTKSERNPGTGKQNACRAPASYGSFEQKKSLKYNLKNNTCNSCTASSGVIFLEPKEIFWLWKKDIHQHCRCVSLDTNDTGWTSSVSAGSTRPLQDHASALKQAAELSRRGPSRPPSAGGAEALWTGKGAWLFRGALVTRWVSVHSPISLWRGANSIQGSQLALHTVHMAQSLCKLFIICTWILCIYFFCINCYLRELIAAVMGSTKWLVSGSPPREQKGKRSHH